MSRKYKARNPEGIYFTTITTIGWVDLFTRLEYKDIIINSLNYCIENKGLNVHAYVIMTSHVHLIVSSQPGIELSSIIRDFKTYTSKKLLKEMMQINEIRRECLPAGIGRDAQ